jgi:uncharacterized DUF497 family protein
MRITFDSIKRARTLADRGLDFEDAAIVFEGITAPHIQHAKGKRS